MMNFICHPVLIHLLEQSKVEMFCQQSSIELVFISDYFPQVSSQVHSGLLEAVKFRLIHPNSYICIFSFYSKEELLQYDTFEILSLTGTIFLRLPFLPEQLINKLEALTQIQLSIPDEEWIIFSIYACRAMLKEKINVLKHGGRLEFVTAINMGLRWEVDLCLKDSLRMPCLMTLLSNLQSDYQNNNEFVELIELSQVGYRLPDEYIKAVSGVVKGLNIILSLANVPKIDLKVLKNDIEVLISNFNKL